MEEILNLEARIEGLKLEMEKRREELEES